MTDAGVELAPLWPDGVGCAEPVGAGVAGIEGVDVDGDGVDVGEVPVGAGVAVGPAVGLPPPDDGDVVELGELVEPGELVEVGELVAFGCDGWAVGVGAPPPACCARYVNALCSVVGVLPYWAYTATS